MRRRHGAALGALVVAFALLFFVEGAALPTAWLPVEEAAALAHARGTGSTPASSGILYPALLAPAARSLSPPEAYRFAKGLSAVLWALILIPAYLLARRLVAPGPALAVAALAVAAPGSVYATAAVPDALALLLAVSSLTLLVRASARESGRYLLGAMLFGAAAALTRPWFVVLPPALLIAFELSHDEPARSRTGSFLRWPRSLAFAGLAAFGYLVLAGTAPELRGSLPSAVTTARAAAATLAVVAVGAGVLPWLLAAGPKRAKARPEGVLLATCLPALLLAAGVFGAAQSGPAVEERPLLALVPLVFTLAAFAWLGGAARVSDAAPAAVLVVVAALALPTLGRVPSARAAGLSLVAPNGGSSARLFAGVTAIVAVALLMLVVLRRRRFVLLAVLTLLVVVGQAAAWTSARREARELAASEPTPRNWVDHNAGSGSRVFVVGPAGALDARALAQLTLWNRSIRGVRQLDVSQVDVPTGQLLTWGSDLALVRGTELAGTVIARSAAGVLMRPPLGVAETVDGLFADGWSGDHATYRRFSGPRKAGTVEVDVSRANWRGQDRPADVRIDSGPLNETGEQRAHIVIHSGQDRKLEIPVPPPPFQVALTVQPTFSPSEFGATDTRQLGAQITFTYRPGK